MARTAHKMFELVREHLRQKPFRPFRVLTRTGERHEITDPERVAIRRPDVFVFSASGRLTHLREDEIELVYEPRSGRTQAMRTRGRD